MNRGKTRIPGIENSDIQEKNHLTKGRKIVIVNVNHTKYI
jgi:hypothetical protein